MYPTKEEFNPYRVQPHELRKLQEIRLCLLDEACQGASLEGPLPVNQRWGWYAPIRPLARDRDGSLMAVVTVFDPAGVIRARRKVRLVPHRRLYLV